MCCLFLFIKIYGQKFVQIQHNNNETKFIHSFNHSSYVAFLISFEINIISLYLSAEVNLEAAL